MGVPKEKLVLGMATYARGWTGVKEGKPGAEATGPAVDLTRFCLKRLPLARERAALASGKDGEAARFADLAMESDAARG